MVEHSAFQSTLPARGATGLTEVTIGGCGISIHAPRTGSDEIPRTCGWWPAISIHAPRTGSDCFVAEECRIVNYFNPRSPHGERPPCRGGYRQLRHISIHAPRTGSDCPCHRSQTNLVLHFNPRSPHGERPPQSPLESSRRRFQSTLPARGATNNRSFYSFVRTDFNPRSPHGERLSQGVTVCMILPNFNPRSPHGERLTYPHGANKQEISIHAPRTGSDLGARRHGRRPHNFNPRSPHGERQIRDVNANTFQPFQSTLPARGATCWTTRMR